MIGMKTFFIGLIVVLSTNLLCAQNSANADIILKAIQSGDSVMIRILPTSRKVWELGNKYGYKIERFALDDYFDLTGQDPTGKGTTINKLPLLPLQKNDTIWNALKRKEPQAEFVYSELFVPPTQEPTDAKKKETFRQNRFGLLLKTCDNSPAIARAHGLLITDKTAQIGQAYIYRVTLFDAPVSLQVKAGIGNTDGKNIQLPAPEKLTGKFQNKKSMLLFDVASSRTYYAGYIVERSEDSVHFVRVNKNLVVFATSQYEKNKTEIGYVDSLPENGKIYWYRVRGYSYFGLLGPTSNVIHGKGKALWTAYPEVDSCWTKDEKSIRLRWHLPANTELTRLKQITILRASSVAGTYQVIGNPLTSSATLFIDDKPQYANYYMICAISNDLDTAYSFPALGQIPDNEPPPTPVGLQGMVDSLGVVTLSWISVQATDLLGYRVYRCNSLGEEMIEISDSVFSQTNFRDSITTNTLTHYVYYAVNSVDRVFNNSKPSAPLKLKRPDKIAPVPPVFTYTAHTDSSIVLRWNNSTSDDVASIDLIRLNTSSGEKPVVLFSRSSNDTSSVFVDFSASAGQDYTYSLIVRDSSMNTSSSKSPLIIYRPRVLSALKNQQIKLNDQQVELTWDKPQEAVFQYVIYRSKKGESMQLYKTLSGSSATLFTDKKIAAGNTYQYRVKAILVSGAETKLGEVLSIDF
jgi:uncharacterized protein